MSKEIYIKEMPKSCGCCECFAEHRRQCELKLCFQWSEEKMKYNDCPLKSLHDHDKELVAKICERIKRNVRVTRIEDKWFVFESDLRNILYQIQKEFEDE